MHAVLSRLLGPAALAATLLTGGCSDTQSGPVVMSVIGTPEQLTSPLKHPTSAASKLILESTAQGLVAFDASGEILPALAQRWIVEDDGRSYIFRLRRARWPDGSVIQAKEIARLLDSRIKANLTLDPQGDLSAVQEVLAMTGEVIEIRLFAPRPRLLQMLAQPQMAILSKDGGTGPYRADRRPGALFLRPILDPAAHDGSEPDTVLPWWNRVLRSERAAKAIVRFRMGQSALVLGGRFSDLPLLYRSGIDNRRVQVDPVQGLFGLAVTGKGQFLDDDGVRAALSMTIDRERLPQYFTLANWGITSNLVPEQLDLPRGPSAPGWTGQTIDERRAAALAAIQRWSSARGGETPPVLRIALPAGSGSRLLFALIASDLRRIGVDAQQVAVDEKADLTLIDEVAAYDSVIWYMSRVSCDRGVHCDPVAQEKLTEAGMTESENVRQALLAEAETAFVAHNGFIALAAPIRWSLAARALNGFTPSPRARHPLNHLFRATN